MRGSRSLTRRDVLTSGVLAAGALTAGLPLGRRVSVARAATADAVPHTLEVVASEYKYDLSSQKVAAGLVTLRFRNAGKVQHQVVLARLRPGKTVTDYVNSRR